MGLDPQNELPLHPTVLRWLHRYAKAPADEQDAIVAGVLHEWNALLTGEQPRQGSPADAPPAPNDSEYSA